MLIQAVAILAICGGSPSQEPTAKKLIETMLLAYNRAKTLTGNIRLTVSASSGSATLDTTVQYERPAKLYIYQQKNVANPDPEAPSRWLVTSDGNRFSYQIENSSYHRAPGLRLTEPVANTRVGVTHTLASIYAASSKSIGDRSTPLDIAISAPGDLAYRAGQWGKGYGKEGKRDFNGKSAFLIGGEFRAYAGAQPSGRYQMAITEEGELMQYTEEINIAVGEGQNPQVVKVNSRWDVNLVVNGKVDPSLFTVISR